MTAAPGFTMHELREDKVRAPEPKSASEDFQRLMAQPITFSSQEKSIILQTCCNGASQQEAQQLIAIAEARGLNPIKGECFFVKRWDSAKRQEVWAVQASIDSFRIKADETGLYDGQDEPAYEYDKDGKLVLAKVRVWRKGIARPFVGVARYDEYVQEAKDKESGKYRPTKFWARMPHNQLAKCAEALAFRKAFPARFSRIYTPEEMAQADNDVAPPPAPVTVDDETGEVTETPESPQVDRAPSKAFDMLSSMLTRCGSAAQLENTWKAVENSFKSQSITPEEKHQLASLKQMTAKRLGEQAREPGSDDA